MSTHNCTPEGKAKRSDGWSAKVSLSAALASQDATAASPGIQSTPYFYEEMDCVHWLEDGPFEAIAKAMKLGARTIVWSTDEPLEPPTY